jgi:hypothetical protein
MSRTAPAGLDRLDALASFGVHRAFERARLGEWAADLRGIADVAHDLGKELHRLIREGAPPEATAGELLASAELAGVDRRLRALAADTAVHTARREGVDPFPAWRSVYAWACSPGPKAGPLNADGLDELGDLLRRLAELVRGFDRLTTMRRVQARAGGGGRLPDIAAAGLVAWGDQHGVGDRELARDLVAAGLEHREGDADGTVPTLALAERLRKARAAVRKSAKRKK